MFPSSLVLTHRVFHETCQPALFGNLGAEERWRTLTALLRGGSREWRDSLIWEGVEWSAQSPHGIPAPTKLLFTPLSPHQQNTSTFQTVALANLSLHWFFQEDSWYKYYFQNDIYKNLILYKFKYIALPYFETLGLCSSSSQVLELQVCVHARLTYTSPPSWIQGLTKLGLALNWLCSWERPWVSSCLPFLLLPWGYRCIPPYLLKHTLKQLSWLNIGRLIVIYHYTNNLELFKVNIK